VVKLVRQVIYSTALEDDQRQAVEAGLAKRYGLVDLSPRVVDSAQSHQPSQATSSHLIDAFIDQKLAENGLNAAPTATRATLIRRAYFDLLGLPPTPEQVDKFVNDTSPFAWEALLTELLSSPQYGERWGRHWLDVACYADTAGFETEEFHRNAWRYRDWVIKAFNDDKPYDRFVQEQIAADELWPANMEGRGAYAVPEEQVAHLEAQFGTASPSQRSHCSTAG